MCPTGTEHQEDRLGLALWKQHCLPRKISRLSLTSRCSLCAGRLAVVIPRRYAPRRCRYVFLFLREWYLPISLFWVTRSCFISFDFKFSLVVLELCSIRLKIIRFYSERLSCNFIAAFDCITVCWFTAFIFAIYLCYNCDVRLQICWWQNLFAYMFIWTV